MAYIKVDDRGRHKKSGTDRRREALAEVESCVCRDRQHSYGDAEDNFANIAVLVEMYLKNQGKLAEGAGIDGLDVAIIMNAVKYSRMCSSRDHMDNHIDNAGYSICAAGILKKMGEDK